jgi:hypothetical protein
MRYKDQFALSRDRNGPKGRNTVADDDLNCCIIKL